MHRGQEREKRGALFVIVLAMVLASALATEAAEQRSGGPGGLHTERLSPKQLRVWRRIVAIVMAEDADGHPVHPMLRQLWDAIDTGGHVVYVEMADRKGSPSYLGGRFVVTRVDPQGIRHEAVLVVNVRAIDRASTQTVA